MNSVLEKLGIEEINPGACSGPDRWYEDPEGEELASYNPSTGDLIGRVIQPTGSTYNQVVEDAYEAFDHWRTVPAPVRGHLVRDLGELLREYKEPLGDLVTLEMGKIRVEGHGEVQEMIDICEFAVGLSRQLYGLTMASERPQHRMFEQWHPLGICGVITSFNFPVAVWSWNAAIASVCGDTVLWKPSGLTPLCAVAVQKLANRVMSDHGVSGVFNLVAGKGREIGERVLNDERIPLISFTGSTQVGRHVATTVASRFGRTILELGGNNGIVVTEDADIDLATRAILFGAVGTAGQRCTTTRRIVMHEDISADLTGRLVSAYQQVSIGNPLDEDILMGPLVTPQAVEEMMDALDQARAQGGEVLTGGKIRADLGPNYVEPAIVKMPIQTEIVERETFAPILYLMDYVDFDEAIEIHNAVPQGLSSAIFTDSMRKMEAFLSTTGSDCGIANVNIGTSGAEIGGAFGGEKETGGGRESGSDAWKGYMRRQTNTVNWSKDLPLAQGIEFGTDGS